MTLTSEGGVDFFKQPGNFRSFGTHRPIAIVSPRWRKRRFKSVADALGRLSQSLFCQ
jgi:hypothetical protein